MGIPEGTGCYCAANNIIRKYTDMLSEKSDAVKAVFSILDQLQVK